jgi:hypothetical protein
MYQLNDPHREPITTGASQMALSARSVYQPQHRLWCSPQEKCGLVFSGQYLQGMEIDWIAFVASRKTYDLLSFPV